jgi:hypothetical protein
MHGIDAEYAPNGLTAEPTAKLYCSAAGDKMRAQVVQFPPDFVRRFRGASMHETDPWMTLLVMFILAAPWVLLILIGWCIYRWLGRKPKE